MKHRCGYCAILKSGGASQASSVIVAEVGLGASHELRSRAIGHSEFVVVKGRTRLEESEMWKQAVRMLTVTDATHHDRNHRRAGCDMWKQARRSI